MSISNLGCQTSARGGILVTSVCFLELSIWGEVNQTVLEGRGSCFSYGVGVPFQLKEGTITSLILNILEILYFYIKVNPSFDHLDIYVDSNIQYQDSNVTYRYNFYLRCVPVYHCYKIYRPTIDYP